MLISDKNKVGLKLFERISSVLPSVIVSPTSILAGNFEEPPVCPRIIFVNQLDVDAREKDILHTLRVSFSEAKIIALHTHMVPALKSNTLEFGYDSYLSLFELGDKLSRLLLSYGLEISDLKAST